MHRQLSLRGTAAGAAVAIALIAAGCGSGGSSTTVASLGSSHPTGTAASGSPSGGAAPGSEAASQTKLVKYAQCMRANGVPNFPDPVNGRLMIKGEVKNGKPVAGSLDPQSPAFQAAQQKCKALAPAGLGSGGSVSPQQQARALKFAACMRSHGVPKFPDPSFSGGGVRITLSPGSGVNPNSPAFQKAQQACRSLSPIGTGGTS